MISNDKIRTYDSEVKKAFAEETLKAIFGMFYVSVDNASQHETKATKDSRRIDALTLSEAGSLIADSDVFQTVEGVGIAPGADEYIGTRRTALAKIAGESTAAALARRREILYLTSPITALFSYLKLATVRILLIDDQKDYPSETVDGNWQFVEHAGLTEKGRQIWAGYGGEIDDLAIPLFRRQLIEVTDLSPKGHHDVAATFKWRVVPNQIGSYCDPLTSKFKSMPKVLRHLFSEEKIQCKLRATLTEEKKNTAYFTYDDQEGWYLTEIE